MGEPGDGKLSKIAASKRGISKAWDVDVTRGMMMLRVLGESAREGFKFIDPEASNGAKISSLGASVPASGKWGQK